MAGKADFTEAEWSAMHKGATGTGMLVSLSDRDFTDTFGEAIIGEDRAEFTTDQGVAIPYAPVHPGHGPVICY